MDHELTIVRTVAMDVSSPVYWVCSCGAASDEDFSNPSGATAHYNAVHATA